MQRISVIGAGYVGLVTAAVFSDMGHRVVCAERNRRRLELLNAGTSPIYEPGLDDLIANAMSNGLIRFTDSTAEATRGSDIVFVAVGTPDKGNGEADVSQVQSAFHEIVAAAEGPLVVVMKSTVPVGTNRWAREELERAGKTEIEVVSSPEFLREGNAIHEARNPERMIFGGCSPDSEERLREVYSSINAPLMFMSAESAELTKYASNCFLATKISFINSISRLCDLTGADVGDVAAGMGVDSRIGKKFLRAGLGWGGSCFPKDVYGLLRQSEAMGYEFDMLRSTVAANDDQLEFCLNEMERRLGGFAGKRIAIWGLAFKPGTDDVRESRSLKACQRLRDAGAAVIAYDPAAMPAFVREFSDVEMADSPLAAVADCDCLLIATEWDEFLSVNMSDVRDSMRRTLIFDGRNMLDPEETRQLGFEYWSVGRPS